MAPKATISSNSWPCAVLKHFVFRKQYLVAFLIMLQVFSCSRRWTAMALAPRLSRSVVRHSIVNYQHLQQHRRSSFGRTLQLFAAAKKSGNYKKGYSLVVHGPPGFDSKKSAGKTSRPFKLVIVESPSKCNTISKILQEYVEEHKLDHDYVVTSCFGHIRNLPKQKESKNSQVAGIDLENGYKPTYVIEHGKEQLVEDLKGLSEKAQQLILATDDDREGEAMAWHLLQTLECSDDFPPLRVRFTEITRKAILQSIQNPETSLRENLVQAQETRRILDRLAGFTVSPILWKKIAPGLSAGRVQSVGMALIVQRERERLLFKETEYWDAVADWNALATPIQGQLVSINDTELASGGSDFEPRITDQLTPEASHKLHLKADDANKLVESLNSDPWEWTVDSIKTSQRNNNPSPPFITSSLQQEASTRLGLSVTRTMQTAQQLYENGYISYMRTDSTHLSDDAKDAIKTEISKNFGGPDFYVPMTTTRKSKKKKSDKPDPQAAHEAIRPAITEDGRFAIPAALPSKFDGAARELYQLIYQRTVASHMPPQVTNQTSIRILGEYGASSVLFRTSGSVVIKPGFTMAYPRQTDKKSPILPSLKEGQVLDFLQAEPVGHVTQPPPRFTEASFVKELEELGVGRPSTYAGTVQILRDRAYVGSPVSGDSYSSANSKAVVGGAISAQRAAGGEEFTGRRNARGPMVPSLTAFVVCSLLEKYLQMYVDPSFTASMEERLDKIANAEENVSDEERINYLHEFYGGENGLAAQIRNIDENVDADDARRVDLPALTSNRTDGIDVGLYVGPWGPFVKKIDHNGANNDDDERPTSAPLPAGMAADITTISLKGLSHLLETRENNGSIIGTHPEDGRNIRLKVGRFGAFLQWGEDDEEGTTTHTLPAHLRTLKNTGVDGEEDSLLGMLGITLEDAIQYVNLPKTVCTMNDLPILAAIGPYGPYLKYNNSYVSLKPADGDILTIDAEAAQELVTEGIVNGKSKRGAGTLAEVGEKDGSMITVKQGRFGMYINWKRVNAKMPADYLDNPSELPLEEAWSLIQEKAENSPAGGKSKEKKKNDSGVDLPPAPKRPQSPYLHFCAEHRPTVSRQFKSLGDVSKELARLWAETSDGDRKPFVEQAEKAKEEYERVKKVWLNECQSVLDKANVKSTTVKGLKRPAADGPKRPKSAYLYFSAANRPEVASKMKTLGEVSKELARLWSETSPKDRKEYEEQAAADKQRYEEEKAHRPSTAKKIDGRKTIKVKSTPKKVSPPSSKSKSSTEKKKRGPSAYMLFCAAHRSDIVDDEGNKLPLGETTKRLAGMWKNCDEATRETFTKEAERQKEKLLVESS